MNIALPSHCLTTISETIQKLLYQRKTFANKWRQLLGILYSSVPALNGVAYLFSILQHALTTPHTHITLTKLVKEVLHV